MPAPDTDTGEPRRGARARRRWGPAEHGGATNVQVAVLFPLLLITVMTILQTGLYLYGRDLALSAARTGLDQGRSFGTANTAAATDRAQSTLAGTASGVLTSPSVSANMNAATMTVTVDAAVTSLIPGLTMHVTESATGALERVTG